MKRIGIASDHAGFEKKEFLKKYLIALGNDIVDFGTNSSESTDYPDYAHPLAKAVEKNDVDLGIALCGTGNGINMTLNKHQDIRAALCWSAEIAQMARLHNDANICSVPARYVSDEEAKVIVDTFLSTDFEGGRHTGRINKIPFKCC